MGSWRVGREMPQPFPAQSHGGSPHPHGGQAVGKVGPAPRSAPGAPPELSPPARSLPSRASSSGSESDSTSPSPALNYMEQ